MINVIAVDDEPLALQLITSYIEKTPFLNLKGTFDNPLSALEFIQDENIELIFLDIQMPDLIGTEFARLISNGSKIVFTTAYEKYAIEGIKLRAIDYLLKPFEYSEFYEAALKAQKIIEEENHLKITDSNKEYLFVKSDYKIKKIKLNDIQYIEGLKDYVKIFLLSDSKPILSISSLKALETKLPETKFMRIHRSFIINLDCLSVIERSRVVFGKEYIPISDQYKDKFQEYLNKNFL